MGNVKWVVTVLIPVVVAPILLNVFTDWSPRLAQWIVQRASRRMPKAYQHRCAEEWLAYLADIPGGTSKLVVALGYWVRIPQLRRAVGAPAFRFRVMRATGRTTVASPHNLFDVLIKVIDSPRLTALVVTLVVALSLALGFAVSLVSGILVVNLLTAIATGIMLVGVAVFCVVAIWLYDFSRTRREPERDQPQGDG